eukprot:g5942.t1
MSSASDFEKFKTAFRNFQLETVFKFCNENSTATSILKDFLLRDGSFNALLRPLLVSCKFRTFYPHPRIGSNLFCSKLDAWFDVGSGLSSCTSIWSEAVLNFAPKMTSVHFQAKKEFETNWNPIDTYLNNETCLIGDQFSLADVVLALHLLPLVSAIGVHALFEKFPSSARWLSTVLEHPCFHPIHPLLPSKDSFTAFILKNHGLVSDWPVSKVRDTFIEFFKAKGHDFVASSPVVPLSDVTLLFANAGMNQFKPIFLGTVDPNSSLGQLKRACNSQKCIRAGGKHNDLDDVGKDNYHHTFFEMLGNWSFGDYFKSEAIHWAFELLVEIYKLPSDRLYATYFGGDEKLGLSPDEEAKEIWLELLPPERVMPFGSKDNFWEMGDTGPCGPCSEIHFDRIGGRNVGHLVNQDDPNVLEIWNLVFIQFNREENGKLVTLPNQHVDTGMGLERVTSILQSMMSNYATDVFSPIFSQIQQITGAREYTDQDGSADTDGVDMAYRVVADHIRTLCFSIADGAHPGNIGRDYVLRRILRRAVRFGKERLGAKQGFFAQLVDVVVQTFGSFYPELISARGAIFDTIKEEEFSFSRTLEKGIERFKKAAAISKNSQLDGLEAFALWDSFGFPIDLTQLMCEEIGLTVDMNTFERCLTEQRERSRAAGKKSTNQTLKFEAEATGWLQDHNIKKTNDSYKYHAEETIVCKLEAILTMDGFVESIDSTTTSLPIGLVLNSTSFYAEAGGQVGDTGTIEFSCGSAKVTDCKFAAGYVLHVCENLELSTSLKVGVEATAKVDYNRRRKIIPNHTFTHILNFALREVLGDQVAQKGSIVYPERLRFDFNNNGPVTTELLEKVEAICKQKLDSALDVFTAEVPLTEAQKINSLRAVFGESYPDPVRVVSIGKPVEDLVASPLLKENLKYSIEFCGGTHLKNTSEAGAFVILSEEGIAKGIRRLVATTGEEAKEALKTGERLLTLLKTAEETESASQEEALNTLKQQLDTAVISTCLKTELKSRIVNLTKAIFERQKLRAGEDKKRVVETITTAGEEAVAAGLGYLILRLDVGLEPKALLEVVTTLRKKHAEICVLLFSVDGNRNKVFAVASVPETLTTRVKAGDWIKTILPAINGKGGGKETVAQAQGTGIDGIDEGIKLATEFIVDQL